MKKQQQPPIDKYSAFDDQLQTTQDDEDQKTQNSIDISLTSKINCTQDFDIQKILPPLYIYPQSSLDYIAQRLRQGSTNFKLQHLQRIQNPKCQSMLPLYDLQVQFLKPSQFTFYIFFKKFFGCFTVQQIRNVKTFQNKLEKICLFKNAPLLLVWHLEKEHSQKIRIQQINDDLYGCVIGQKFCNQFFQWINIHLQQQMEQGKLWYTILSAHQFKMGQIANQRYLYDLKSNQVLGIFVPSQIETMLQNFDKLTDKDSLNHFSVESFDNTQILNALV